MLGVIAVTIVLIVLVIIVIVIIYLRNRPTIDLGTIQPIQNPFTPINPSNPLIPIGMLQPIVPPNGRPIITDCSTFGVDSNVPPGQYCPAGSVPISGTCFNNQTGMTVPPIPCPVGSDAFTIQTGQGMALRCLIRSCPVGYTRIAQCSCQQNG